MGPKTGKSQPFNAINRDLLSFKAFYFFFLSGFGSLFPYLPVYFRQVGLSAYHVGLLIGLRPIVQLASAPFWAIMADKYKKRKAILVMSILTWLVMTLALAFVESTDGICELRAENASTSRFVNYTKIKTGFFRRSFATKEKHPEQGVMNAVMEENPDLVVVPLRHLFVHDAYKLEPRLVPLASNNVTDNPNPNADSIVSATELTLENDTNANSDNASRLRSNSSNTRNITRFNQTLKVGNSKTLQKHSQRNGKNRKQGRTLRGFVKKDNVPRNNHINHNKNTAALVVSQVHNNPAIMINTGSKTRLKIYNYHSKPQRTLPRVINKKTTAKSFQSKAKKIIGFFDNKISQTTRKSNENASADLTEANNEYNVKNQTLHQEDASTLTTSRNTKYKTRSTAVQFSKGDFVTSRSKEENVSHAKFGTDNVASGSAELEESGSQEEETIKNGNNSITKNVKKATQRLRMQLEKSINFLSNMADNSSKHLLHKTIAMFSNQNATTPTSVEDRRNSSQLSNAFKNLIKSSQMYVAFDASGENSAEGSSSAFDAKHDFTNLAHLMINQKDDLKTLDRLHQEKSGNSNKDVIHHSVLPDHVLHSHTNKTAVLPNVEYAQDQTTSGSGMDVNYFNSEETSGVKIKTLNLNVKKDYSTDYSTEQEVPKSAYSGDNNLDNEDQTSKMTEEFEHENLLPQVKMKPPPSSGYLVSQVQFKFKNSLKSNKLEMSRVFMILLILVVVGEFLESPSFILTDASLLEILGENRRFYGRQRLWGSIGFGVCSFIVGLLLERSNHVVCGEQYTDYMICFCAFGIMMLLTLFVTTSFDFHYSDVQSSSSSVLSALCNLHYGSCLLAACVMGINFSMCHNFLTWFLEDLGASKSLMGLAVVSRAFADTITFYFAGSVIKAIGQIRIMILVFISYTVILLTLSILHNPWWVIPIEILDGLTYAMAWSACTSYLAGAVPAESVTTLQGILQGIYWGLGTGSGTITGGYLIHHIGAVTTFRMTAAFTFTMCLLFSTIQWKWTSGETNEYPQTKYTYLPAVESKDTEALLSGYALPRNKRKSGRIKTKFNNPY